MINYFNNGYGKVRISYDFIFFYVNGTMLEIVIRIGQNHKYSDDISAALNYQTIEILLF